MPLSFRHPPLSYVRNSLRSHICRIFAIGSASCFAWGVYASAIEKPIGTFSASGATTSNIYENPNLQGVLVRTTWDIIEPEPGVFDLSSLTNQIATAEANGKAWSLSVNGGGIGSPRWLTEQLNAPYVDFTFRGEPGFRLPLFWNETVLQQLAILADRLGQEYAGNPNLKLVYITQMTTNGLEGHLQGVDMNTLRAAGFSDDLWADACLQTTHSFANAFPKKALAFEVHEIDRSAILPTRIMYEIWNDPTLEQRVGIGMWWISGKTSYQPDLIDALTDFPGDIYGQVIGRSNQTERFQNEDYTSVFAQAEAIGMRYIEPWEYEFKYGNDSASGAWDEIMANFNQWALETYGNNSTASHADLDSLRLLPSDSSIRLAWNSQAEKTYRVERSFDLNNWIQIDKIQSDSNSEISILDPVDNQSFTTRFYRIVKTNQ